MKTDRIGSGALALRQPAAAKALGFSQRLLWQLTNDGEIPCVRVGTGKRKLILYPVEMLQEWLRQQAETKNEEPLPREDGDVNAVAREAGWELQERLADDGSPVVPDVDGGADG